MSFAIGGKLKLAVDDDLNEAKRARSGPSYASTNVVRTMRPANETNSKEKWKEQQSNGSTVDREYYR